MRAFLQNYLAGDDSPADINAPGDLFANENKPQWYAGLCNEDLSTLDALQVCSLRSQAQARIAESRPGTVIVKTHNYQGQFEGWPLHNLAVTAGAIYVVRNPLDVVLSVADHFGLSTDDAIAFINSEEAATGADEANMGSLLGSWSFHVQSWTEGAGDAVCVVRYEDMLEKPVKAFSAALALLQQPRDKARLKRAIRNSSFAALRKQESRHGFIERSENSRRFFREGRANQWRTVLTPEQVQAVVAANREQMARFNYLPKGY